MNQGNTVFAQLMSMIPEYEFDKCVDCYNGNHRVRYFTCRNHFYVMSFAQLTQRDSLRDIENCLKTVSGKLYHCGIKHAVPGNTLEVDTINTQLEGLKIKVIQIANQLSLQGKPFNVHTIRKRLEDNESS